MQKCAIHELKLLLWSSDTNDFSVSQAEGQPPAFRVQDIEPVAKVFGLSFSDFTKASDNVGQKAGYSITYSYKNLIFFCLDCKWPRSRGTLYLIIKGAAFDTPSLIDLENLRQFLSDQDDSATCSGIHLRHDSAGILSFNRLKKCVDKYYFSSDYSPHYYPGKTKDSPRSLILGSEKSPLQLLIYEAGRLRPEVTSDYISVELHLRREKAQAAYEQWLEGKDLQILVKEVVGATFIPHDLKCKDTNTTRRKNHPLPEWVKFLDGIAAAKLTAPGKAKDPNSQLEALARRINTLCQEISPEKVQAAVTRAINDFKRLIDTRDQQYIDCSLLEFN